MSMKSTALLAGLLLCTLATSACADAPVLYSQPAYQSPVQGSPDDLLLLPGAGFASGDTVVYSSLANTSAALTPPKLVPLKASATVGVAPVVNSADEPYALTVQLPAVMKSNQSYALWVRNSKGQWSNGVRINDARPLWFSPAYAYSAAALAGLPRQLRLVGRNLQAASGATATVRLSGPQQLSLGATVETAAVSGYIATAALPASLAAGNYSVSFSRDGVSWVSLPDTFTVRPDPQAPAVFPVANYGCAANDGIDDTSCVLQAIQAAQAAGGGVVQFGAGTWDLTGTGGGSIDGNDGIVVPSGVGLAGAGGSSSRILRHADWNRASTQPVFTLEGLNTVRGLVFADTPLHQSSDPFTPALVLGKVYYRVASGAPRVVDQVEISGNTFDKVYSAVDSGGLPVSHLFIVNNVFGAYASDLLIGGNRFDMTDPFRIDDSIVALNKFEPGSYLDLSAATGTIASQLGASRHLDFSRNTADGSATGYLNAAGDARGWRAGFFWNLQGDQELSIAAQNQESCTGDKIGDGEAMSFDNNANTFAFDSARSVISAGPNTVTVQGPLQSQQNGASVSSSYYVGHWVQVSQGAGLGQVRKITAYSTDSSSGQVTFTVAPAWDVAPAAGSRIAAGREFWQFYLVGNTVDHRQPLCQKSNRSAQKGGSISVYAQSADSVVANNSQYDSDGILYIQSYSVPDPQQPALVTSTFFQSFLEVSGNLVDGEYNWDADCSSSGIQGADSASNTPSSTPPVAGYGVSIAHNSINHADGVHGGAISLALAGDNGPTPHNWQLVSSTLVHHNQIQNITAPGPSIKCQMGASDRRIGLSLDHPMVWHSTLYANSCTSVATPMVDLGTATTRICPGGTQAQVCECASAQPLQQGSR